MQEAQRWWISSGIVALIFVCAISTFAWWHQYELRQVFRVEADSLDEGRMAPQLTLETQLTLESYETMNKR